MKYQIVISSAIAAICLTASDFAAAQEAALDEIIVTARRVEERLQTTPIAVTALTAEDLAQAQITQVSDLQRTAPALALSSGGPAGPGTIYASIRGLTNSNANSVSDGAVGIYMDGVYIARQTGGNLGFLDLAQVEVLRGPQGTLFGRNTTGGALNLTTVMPGAEREGYVSTELGNYNSAMVTGAATIPISGDALSLRVAGRYGRRDGYYDDPLRGGKFNDLSHDYAGRATLRIAPVGGPVRVLISADFADWRANGQANALIGYNPLVFGAFGLPAPTAYLVGPGGTGRFDQTYQFPNTGIPELDAPHDHGINQGVSITANIDLSQSWSLKSISAWRRNDLDNGFDIDATPLDLLAFASTYRQHQYSEELQLSGAIGNLDVIAGAFWFNESGTEQSIATAFQFAGFPSSLDRATFDSTSTAVFAQTNYHFTDRLRGTVGYRQTWDKREIARIATGFADQRVKFDYPAWTVGLDYEASNNLFLYVRSSQASMAGGFNTRPTPPGLESFEPEQTTDVELGAKLDMFDRKLRANLAVFTSETKDAQRLANAIIGGRLSQFVRNTGDVDASGFELELTGRPWMGMEINAGYSYLDTSYVSGTFIEDRGTPGAPILVDRSREPIPQAPETSYSIGLNQEFELGLGKLSVHADYTYYDKKVFYVDTAAPGSPQAVIDARAEANRLGTTDSYGLINGRAALKLANGLEFSIWGRNLADKEYFTYAFDLYESVGFSTGYQGAPRTFGVGLRYSF